MLGQKTATTPDTVPSSPKSKAAEANRIHSLDGLRGVLALFVCTYHLHNSLPLLKSTLAQTTAFMDQGWVAVDVFFALSGFVMCYVYEATFKEKVSLSSWGKFMWARFTRLYPVHLFAMLLLLVVLGPFLIGRPDFYQLDGRYSVQSFVAALFMLQGPWWPIRTWNYPSWSISVEWHLYIIFPFLLGIIRSKTVSLAIALSIPVLAVLLYVVVLKESNAAGLAEFEPFPTNGPASLLRGILLFLNGIAIYGLRNTRLMSKGWAAAVTVVAFVLLLQRDDTAAYAVGLVGPLVLATVLNDRLSRILSVRPVLFLGKISYSLYMVHAIVQVVYVNRIKDVLGGGQEPGLVLAIAILLSGVALSLVLGTLVHLMVELPARDWLRARSRKRANATVVDSQT